MRAILEKAEKDTAKLKSRPYWIVVDKQEEPVQLKDKKGKVVNSYIETSVRCNIGIIDYQSKEDAELIAAAIIKALKPLEGK